MRYRGSVGCTAIMLRQRGFPRHAMQMLGIVSGMARKQMSKCSSAIMPIGPAPALQLRR
jgi:hypothetical protein